LSFQSLDAFKGMEISLVDAPVNEISCIIYFWRSLHAEKSFWLNFANVC